MSKVTMSHMCNHARARLEAIFGAPAVDYDGTVALFDNPTRAMRFTDMCALARETHQVVDHSLLQKPGHIERVGDRTYIFGEDGKWHRQ